MNRFNSAVVLLMTLVTMAACASTDPPVGPTTVPTPAPAPAPPPTNSWPKIPTGAMRWVGFVPPLDGRELPLPVEIMNSQGGSRAGFYIVDSQNNVVATEVFTVSAIGLPNILKDREIIVDIQVRNYANTCTFNASGVYLVNDFPAAFLEGFGSGFEIPAAGGPPAPGSPGPPPVTVRDYRQKLLVRDGARLSVQPTGGPANTIFAFPSGCR